MATVDDLTAMLDDYVAAMSAQCAGFAGFFAPPAAPEDLAALEAALGAPVPDQLRRLLARHDGSSDAWVVPGYRLLSARHIAQEWRVWEELRITEFEPDGIDCTPEGPIRGDLWWRSGWVPFAGDGTGDFLCIDTDPAPGGSDGQIITLRHDHDLRTVLAPSLAHWFRDLAAWSRDRRLVWDSAGCAVVLDDGTSL